MGTGCAACFGGSMETMGSASHYFSPRSPEPSCGLLSKTPVSLESPGVEEGPLALNRMRPWIQAFMNSSMSESGCPLVDSLSGHDIATLVAQLGFWDLFTRIIGAESC